MLVQMIVLSIVPQRKVWPVAATPAVELHLKCKTGQMDWSRRRIVDWCAHLLNTGPVADTVVQGGRTSGAVVSKAMLRFKLNRLHFPVNLKQRS